MTSCIISVPSRLATCPVCGKVYSFRSSGGHGRLRINAHGPLADRCKGSYYDVEDEARALAANDTRLSQQ